jgi:hypothetical protein
VGSPNPTNPVAHEWTWVRFITDEGCADGTVAVRPFPLIVGEDLREGVDIVDESRAGRGRS